MRDGVEMPDSVSLRSLGTSFSYDKDSETRKNVLFHAAPPPLKSHGRRALRRGRGR